MKQDPKALHEFICLVIQSLEGVISEEDFRKLDQMIGCDAELARHYVYLISLNSDLCKPGQVENFMLQESADNAPFDSTVMAALAEYEKIAPAEPVEEEEEPKHIRIDRIVKPNSPRQINRVSLIAALTAVAALVFLLVYIHFVTPPRIPVPVATITDTVQAQWAGSYSDLREGSRLSAVHESIILTKGLTKLLFDNQAQVVIEAPAEFEITTEDQLHLTYGRLYAIVPHEAMGFTVTSRKGKIIDLGTEFGVEVDLNGDTELHVLKGKTTLISGEKQEKSSAMVTEGQARKISGPDALMSDISCSETKFVREIRMQDGFVWRGESLRLADVVAGGNGFGMIPSLIGINPATGQYTHSIVRDNRASKKPYNPVPDSKFIDGVFVPDGGNGPIPVTSAGHLFACPNTKGLFTHEIAAYEGTLNQEDTTIPPAVFDGGRIQTDTEFMVMLHSNVGITIDLAAVRRANPGLEINTFTARGALTEAVQDSADQPDVGFWILVDGQVRYEKELVTLKDGVLSFDIPLNLQDRFLTLIVTDGMKISGNTEFPYANDFFYLIDPELSLAGGSQQ